jgi:hypothetical protein
LQQRNGNYSLYFYAYERDHRYTISHFYTHNRAHKRYDTQAFYCPYDLSRRSTTR